MTRYGSDLIADLLNRYGIPYAALNPGASYRGLHDSIVNHAGGRPEIVECPHEEIAVQISHGYAKVTGRPMATVLHNVVGLLHSNMAIYYAYLDRAPIMLLGASGPMAVGRRRPRLDWEHTAVVQGNAIRDYVKWDDQPFDAEGVVHAFARGYRVALTEPQGPVYVCYDVAFQEDELSTSPELTDPAEGGVHSRIGVERAAMDLLVRGLLSAKRPVIVADHVGRHAQSVPCLVELAEFLAAPVIDLNGRFNFPNTHPLWVLDKKPLRDADLVLALDVHDLHGCLSEVGEDDRPTGKRLVPENCHTISIQVEDLEMSSWAQNSHRFTPVDLSILADTSVALPEVLAECRRRVAEASPDSSVAKRGEPMRLWQDRHAEYRARWREQAQAEPDASPMTPARMVSAVGDAIKGKDWVLTANTVKDWARKLWAFDQPYRHAGRSLGTATQIGISLGVALAHRGDGKLVVDLEPDGDLMYDVGALWVASHSHLPMLVVMYNNRAYYNSWNHQYRVAAWRGRNQANKHVGTELDNPAPDFAGLARSLGWYAEGAFTRADELPAALERAIHVIEMEGKPALVDAVTQGR